MSHLLRLIHAILTAVGLFILTCQTSPTPYQKRESGLAIPFTKRLHTLSKRTLPVTLANHHYFYTVDLSFGTPHQPLTLSFDTELSDTWVFNPAACLSVSCAGGSFTCLAVSQTCQVSSHSAFAQSYADGSRINGIWAIDDVVIGGKSLNSIQFGVARSATGFPVANPYGVLGLGLDTNEILQPSQKQYRNFIDDLFDSGVISSRVFSVWMDDFASGTGTLLFGGDDTSHYIAPIISVPLNQDSDGVFRQYSIDYTAITIIDESGTNTVITPKNHRAPTILMTGTTFIHVPTALYTPLATYFNVNPSDMTVSCGLGSLGGSVVFDFPGGIRIKVAFSELALALDNPNVCRFAFYPNDAVTAFGDPFLRSAYVHFDIDGMQIGLAQAKF